MRPRPSQLHRLVRQGGLAAGLGAQLPSPTTPPAANPQLVPGTGRAAPAKRSCCTASHSPTRRRRLSATSSSRSTDGGPFASISSLLPNSHTRRAAAHHLDLCWRAGAPPTPPRCLTAGCSPCSRLDWGRGRTESGHRESVRRRGAACSHRSTGSLPRSSSVRRRQSLINHTDATRPPCPALLSTGRAASTFGTLLSSPGPCATAHRSSHLCVRPTSAPSSELVATSSFFLFFDANLTRQARRVAASCFPLALQPRAILACQLTRLEELELEPEPDLPA